MKNKKPKYMKYMYEYIFDVDKEGYIYDFRGKNKYLVCYKDGERVYFKSKNVFTRMRSIDKRDLKSFDSSECFTYFTQKYLVTSMQQVKLYSYENINTTELLNMFSPQNIEAKIKILEKRKYDSKKEFDKIKARLDKISDSHQKEIERLDKEIENLKQSNGKKS